MTPGVNGGLTLEETPRDEVAWLRRELGTRTEEPRRKDRGIAALASQSPKLPAQPEPVAPPRRRRRWDLFVWG